MLRGAAWCCVMLRGVMRRAACCVAYREKKRGQERD